MKKYCLTTCFKRKMSKTAENVIAVVFGITMMVVVVLLYSAIAYGVGWSLHSFGLFTDNKNLIDLGTSAIWGFALIVLVSYAIQQMIFFVSKMFARMVSDKYNSKHPVCKMFEECKKEGDEDVS